VICDGDISVKLGVQQCVLVARETFGRIAAKRLSRGWEPEVYHLQRDTERPNFGNSSQHRTTTHSGHHLLLNSRQIGVYGRGQDNVVRVRELTDFVPLRRRLSLRTTRCRKVNGAAVATSEELRPRCATPLPRKGEATLTFGPRRHRHRHQGAVPGVTSLPPQLSAGACCARAPRAGPHLVALHRRTARVERLPDRNRNRAAVGRQEQAAKLRPLPELAQPLLDPTSASLNAMPALDRH